MRAVRWVAALCAFVLCSSVHAPARAEGPGLRPPADWVPAQWPWPDASSLELLANGPINCLLLRTYSPELIASAANRGVATLAVLTPEGDALQTARRALAAHVNGIALMGEFEDPIVAEIRQAAGESPVVELGSRRRMLRNADAAILATNQGLWPGIAVQENGAAKAGPTGSAWIDTNTGFLRAARAFSGAPLWVASGPPPGTVVTVERYLQAIADAAVSGARWVWTLDSDFTARLAKREPKAMADWRRMLELARYFEQHPEWREMRESGQLALVQDPARGAFLSGGIFDMIAARHTPARLIPPQRLTPGSFEGATMAVDMDTDALTPAGKEVLRDFTRSGGTLLNIPPAGRANAADRDNITLDKSELARINDAWRDVNSMVGRRNLGVRLFNASSMLSNLLVSNDGKTTILQLVNYSDYPVTDLTAHFLGEYKRATLLRPEGAEKPLELYKTDEGSGVDIDKVSVCATVKLEQ